MQNVFRLVTKFHLYVQNIRPPCFFSILHSREHNVDFYTEHNFTQ